MIPSDVRNSIQQESSRREASSADDPAPQLSIIVPTYQEVENLPVLIPALAEALQPEGIDYEIIVVDDASDDGTEDCIEQLRRQGHPVELIVRRNQRGLSSAVVRGFREARGRLLLCMDADLSHPPQRVVDLVRALDDEAVDFVIGSRYVPGASTDGDWGVLRWLNSKGATLLARPFCSARDPMAGFFALRRSRFLQAGQLSPVGYKIGLELIVKCRCTNVQEVPIHFADRARGQSKLTLAEQLNYLRHIKRLAEFRFGTLAQVVEFCAVGAVGMVADLSAYALLLAATVPLPVARALAIWLAMTINFALNRRLAFSYSRKGPLLQQYVRFVASCILGAVISWGVSVALPHYVPLFADHVLIAAALGVVAGTAFNFTLSYLWVFPKPGKRRPVVKAG